MFRCLDAEKAVGDPLRVFGCASFPIELKARGDFALPILFFAEEEDGIDGCRAGFAAHFFEKKFEVHANAAGEEDRNVEEEFRLSFDESIESVGHFGVEKTVLLLLIDDAFVFGTEVNEVAAGNNAKSFGDAIAHFHGARASAGEEGQRRVFAKKGMADRVAEAKNAREEFFKLGFKGAFEEVGTVDAKDSGFAERFNEGQGHKHAGIFFRAKDVLQDVACDLIDPVGGNGKFGKIDEHGAVFVRKEIAGGAGGMLKVDPLEKSRDLVGEEEPFEKRCGTMAA